jgi:hypothetical protein
VRHSHYKLAVRGLILPHNSVKPPAEIASMKRATDDRTGMAGGTDSHQVK